MDTIEVGVNGQTMKWYRSRGYVIPTHRVQLYATKDGKKIKNGLETRVRKGTKITVQTSDLMPSSNQIIKFKCEACGRIFTTSWKAHRSKISNNCVSCQAKK